MYLLRLDTSGEGATLQTSPSDADEIPPATTLYTELSLPLEQRRDWDHWDVLFRRQEATYILWPFGKQRNFQKVKVSDARAAQNMSVIKNAVFEDGELSLRDNDAAHPSQRDVCAIFSYIHMPNLLCVFK